MIETSLKMGVPPRAEINTADQAKYYLDMGRAPLLHRHGREHPLRLVEGARRQRAQGRYVLTWELAGLCAAGETQLAPRLIKNDGGGVGQIQTAAGPLHRHAQDGIDERMP